MPTHTRVLLAALLALSAATALADPIASPPVAPATQSFPALTLNSASLRVSLYLPDPDHGFYRGSRFDGSGMISQVQYRGHSFYSEWRIPHDPAGNDHAVGTVEEFGMQVPLNYTDSAPGETFTKIGVGREKRRKEESYCFWTNYPIVEYYPFVITKGPAWVQFVQTAPAYNGYAYTYTKKVTLEENAPVITIVHTLKNTGEKVIDSNWYCHNFTTIDNDPIGPAYTLEFPFPIQTNPAWGDVTKVDGSQKLIFAKTVDVGHELKGGFDTPVPNQIADNAFTITNTRTQAAVKATSDFAVKNFGFFAAPLCLCPEPFLQIRIGPKEEKTWTTTYAFSAPDKDVSHPGH